MPIRAARLTAHGRPLAVEVIEDPVPGAGDVEIDMRYGGVNPIDRYLAEGRVAPDARLPRTLGGEGVGLVDGRAHVVSGHGLGAARDGVWATRAAVPRDALVLVPDGVDLAQAAGVGVAGATAWSTVVTLGQVGPEDRVAVLGASGGVGSVIVSLARSLGAEVWGQTGNAEKADWVVAQGATRAVVADAGGLAAALADLRPTVVLDPLGGGFTGAAVEALEPRGRLVIYGTSAGTSGEVPLQPLYRKGLRVLGYGGLIAPPDGIRAAVEAILEEVAAGRVCVPVDRVLPLDDVNEAFALLVDRALRGKVLLDLAD